MIELAVILVVLIILFIVIYYPFFSPSSQLLGKIIFHKSTKQKVMALTFDDGPNEPYTSQILEILKKYNIKATFFPVGENILREKEILRKIFQLGHEIGNHSYDHAFFASISSSYEKEIAKTQNLIKNIIGKPPILFRPPWLFRTPAMLKVAKKLGLTTITGIFGSYFEVFKMDPEKIARDAIKNTRPGAIIIFHDGYNNKGTNRTQTVETIRIIIPHLQKSGYKFVTVSQLLEMESNV